jgi:type II secretory pathway component PulJ
MPQILFFGVIAAVAFVGYRSFKREAQRVHEKVRRAERESQTHANGTLVQDPKTGEYIVKRD